MSRVARLGESGFALALAVFALVVIGALVATTFFVARLEHRSGGNVMAATQAFEAAEAGIALGLEAWDPVILEGLPVGADFALSQGELAGGVARYQVRATRLAARVFLVSSVGERHGRDGRVVARRVVGTLVRSDGLGGVHAISRGWAQLYE